jgi:hypothetical protein
MENIYIYGLVDPTNNELRYVGKSINPNSRYRKHLQDSKKKISYKDKWIDSLLNKKIKPELLIIDVVSNDNWGFWEIHYISYFKSIGCRLSNLTNGGENPPNHKGRKRTPQEIKKISDSQKGMKRTDESKKKMSDAKKGKPIPHLNNGKPRTEEHKKNLGLSLKGRVSPNKGKKFSNELCLKLSNSSTSKKRVKQLTMDGKLIKEWDSINEAKKKIKNGHISECCLGKVKSAGGYKWEYC